jgi:hypothetical protein
MRAREVLVLVLCLDRSRWCEALKESDAGETTELTGFVDSCEANDVPGCGTLWFYHIVSNCTDTVA